MGRIINAESHLKNLLKDGTKYYIGFGLSTLTEDGKIHIKLNELINSKITDFVVSGKKGPLIENVKGKFIRSQPESKETIEKHIEYYSTYHAREISYDRDFHIWKKELLHKFELRLYKSTSPQGEIIIHFPIFEMKNTANHFLKAKAAMNICHILGEYFQLFDIDFEPIMKITEHLSRKVLQPGIGRVEDKVQEVKERILNGEYKNGDSEGNSYRFALLQDYKISDIIDGEGGFNEYLIFEFASNDIVVLENLKSGNATFIFKLSKFDRNYILDKQSAKEHPSFLERVIHHNVKDWENTISKYLTNKSQNN